MVTVGELIDACTNEWETIRLYSEERGLIGIYRQRVVISDTRTVKQVKSWYYKADEKALYIAI